MPKLSWEALFTTLYAFMPPPITKCLISKYLAFFINNAHVKKLNGGICISGEIIFIQSEIQKVYFSSLLGTKTVAVADKSKHSA